MRGESSGQKAFAALKFHCPPLLISPRTVPSSETASAQTPAAATVSHSHQGREGGGGGGVEISLFHGIGFAPGEESIFVFAIWTFWSCYCGSGVAWSLLMWQRVLWPRRTPSQTKKRGGKGVKKEKCLQTPAKSCLGATPSQYIAQTESVPAPDSFKLAGFSGGEVTSVQMCCLPSAVRMSISAALK